MIGLLQLLIFGHTHKWETVETVNLWDGEHGQRPIGYRVYLKCSVCGNHKKKDMK